MSDEKIVNIDDFDKKVQVLINSGSFTYRGQCCSAWSLEPGIIRRIKKTYTKIGESGLLFRLSVDHIRELLRSARKSKHFKQSECDLNILAILQHYGAATLLIDFTNNPLIALYFACLPWKENGIESDGKIFTINYSRQIRSNESPIWPVNDPAEICIEEALNRTHYIWYWEPSAGLPCKRSKKQESVFIFGWGLYWSGNTANLVDELNMLVISANHKKAILKQLEERYGISEQTLFPDRYGFAQSNRSDKIIQHFDAEEFYAKGEEQWSDGSFEWAREYYKMAYTAKPDWLDARYKHALCLKFDGYQDEALDVIAESIEKCGEKWQFLVCKAIINHQIENDWKEDLKKAEEIANNANESCEFESFVEKHGDFPFQRSK